MRKIISAAVLVLATIGLTYAHPPGSHHGHAHGESCSPETHAANASAFMKDKLDLTEEQQQQIYNLHLNRSQQMQEYRAEANEMTREALRQHHEQMVETERAALTEILTAEQYAKWEELIKDHQGKKPKADKKKKKRGRRNNCEAVSE